MPPAIVVDDVWKQYLIGRARYSSLRDTIAGGWRRLCGRPAQSETERTREFYALKGVSFEVEQGTTLGIIGPNGAGKSTLLKLISRVTRPTKGTITTHGRVSALIEVGAGFHPELTGRENVYLNGSILGMTRREVKSKLDAIIDFSGLEEFIDTPVKYYSSGMYARLGFSVAAHVEPDILVVDEVLSVGDWGFQQKCLERMQKIVNGGTTIVFVSHNMTAIVGVCQRALLLKEGNTLMHGAVHEAITGYNELMSSPSEAESEGKPAGASVQLVTLKCSPRTETRVFAAGQRFALTVDVTFRQGCVDPVVHLHLRDSKAISLFGTDTKRAGLRLGSVRPGETVRLRMTGRMNLLGGSYRFAAQVMPNATAPPMASTGRICTFEVQPQQSANGIVDLRSTIEVVSTPAETDTNETTCESNGDARNLGQR